MSWLGHCLGDEVGLVGCGVKRACVSRSTPQREAPGLVSGGCVEGNLGGRGQRSGAYMKLPDAFQMVCGAAAAVIGVYRREQVGIELAH